MKIYRLQELKTNQLRKLYLNGNITEDQFEAADKFFKKYPAYEKEIDWNRGLKITWEDLEKVIKKERNSKSIVKKKIRKGLEGFKEGEDYLILEETGDYVAYQPFTWESSRMIASHYIEPSRNEEGKIKDARWCTAYQKDRTHWDEHNDIEAFIYLCGESIPTKKVAISISKEDEDANGIGFLYHLDYLNFNIWDFDDHNFYVEEDELLEVVPNLHALIKKAYDNRKDKGKLFSKLRFNPKTRKYDYYGDLSNEKLKNFIAEDKDGFTINFGRVTGDFNCSNFELTSLKGAPQEVGGAFYCAHNHLTSLKGSPQTVGLTFWCSDNHLTSLKGCPQTVGGHFWCSDNHLTSLEGCPQTVGGNFKCSGNQLTSLKGAPLTVSEWFDCRNNPILHSLDGIGKVKGTIYKDF